MRWAGPPTRRLGRAFVGMGRGRVAAAMFVVVVTGWAVLWSASNPPGAAPDEPSHYVKAVAAGTGDLTGKAVPFANIQQLHAFSPASLRQVRHAYRSFTIPRRLRVATNPPCTAFRRRISGACYADPRPTPGGAVYSIAGAYPPWFYLPGGVLTRFAWSVRTGYLLARLGSALAAGLLLAGGMWIFLDRVRKPAVLLAGMALAVTPMVVFLSSEVGASGAETLGAVASAAAFLRLSRLESVPSPAVWWVAGALFGLTSLTRPLAPVWVLFGLAVAVGRLGIRASWRRWRAGGRPAVGAVALAVLGMIGSLGWTQVFKVRTSVQWNHLGHGLWVAWRVVPTVGRQVVGVFGWQDTSGPDLLYRAWWVAGIVVLALAVLVACRWRDRLVVVGAAAVVCALYAIIAAAIFEQNGFGMQGRYILPALVMLPLLAAETLAPRVHNRPVRVAGWVAGAAIALTGTGQLVGWWANARRYAVGPHGPVWFLRAAQWQPAGGWPLSVALAIGLASVTVAAGVLAAVDRPGSGRDRYPDQPQASVAAAATTSLIPDTGRPSGLPAA